MGLSTWNTCWFWNKSLLHLKKYIHLKNKTEIKIYFPLKTAKTNIILKSLKEKKKRRLRFMGFSLEDAAEGLKTLLHM